MCEVILGVSGLCGGNQTDIPYSCYKLEWQNSACEGSSAAYEHFDK